LGRYLKLVANNSRFLIRPDCHHKNLASKILSHIKWRIQNDGQNQFGYPLLLLEALPDFFKQIDDPRRKQGLKHRLSCVLAMAVATTPFGKRCVL